MRTPCARSNHFRICDATLELPPGGGVNPRMPCESDSTELHQVPCFLRVQGDWLLKQERDSLCQYRLGYPVVSFRRGRDNYTVAVAPGLADGMRNFHLLQGAGIDLPPAPRPYDAESQPYGTINGLGIFLRTSFSKFQHSNRTGPSPTSDVGLIGMSVPGMYFPCFCGVSSTT